MMGMRNESKEWQQQINIDTRNTNYFAISMEYAIRTLID